MIRQFRNLSPLNLFLLAAFAVLIRLGYFGRLPDTLFLDFEEPCARFLVPVELSNALSPLANVSIALVLVFIQSLIFNRVINRHNLVGKSTYLPALMFLTTSALLTNFLFLSPALVCNFLLIWMMDKFLKIGKSPNAIMIMFDIGMIIAIGTLIYFPFIVMLVMIWLALLLYRSFNWREWISGLVGFLIIFFFVAVFYYWNDSLSMFYKIWLPLANKFPSVFKINYNDYLVLVPVLVMMILAIIQLRENFFRSFINTRKAFQMLFFMFIVSAGSFYTKPDFRLYHFLLCVPPGAVLLAYYFSNAKKRWFYESLFLILVFAIQYFLFV